MNIKQLIFISIACVFALYIEFRNLKTDALFYSWFEYLPIVMLISMTLFIGIINLRVKQEKLKNYVPFFIGLICITTIYGHAERIKYLEKTESKFEARNEQIGSDGGLILDFKKNGFLKAEKRDHWCVTYYWGTYTQKKDKIIIDVPFNFKLSNTAMLKDTVLIFSDSVKFNVLQ